MGPFSRPYIVQMTYHKLYNVLGQLSAFYSGPKSNNHPWLRVVHVGISAIFNGRCYTSERELHCYAFVTAKLYQTAIAKGVLRRRVFIYRRIWCMLSLQKFKYCVTPPTGGR